jgi:hypothetical protein
MLQRGVKINFAHQTFKWSNEAKGKAAVYCVIICFALFDRAKKQIFHYTDIKGEPVASDARQINAYLMDAPSIFVDRRSSPLCKVSQMYNGSVLRDEGNFILSEEEHDAILQKEPESQEFIRPLVGGIDFLHNIKKYCIWLKDANPSKFGHCKEIMRRVNNVRIFREKSAREQTRKQALTPSLFSEIRQPESDYVLIPRTSSEKRIYVPVSYFSKEIIANNDCQIIPNATLFEFGVITSMMHMAWMKYVCGRLKSDYRYSASIVYNNFPWPTPNDKQKEKIEEAARAVLDARAAHPDSSLADLYDPLAMPPDLLKAHQKLDRVVERAYGREFNDDSERVAYLFELYQQLTGNLLAKPQTRGKGRKIS